MTEIRVETDKGSAVFYEFGGMIVDQEARYYLEREEANQAETQTIHRNLGRTALPLDSSRSYN